MKVPKQIRKYCPYCRTYTEHKLVIVKPRIQRGGMGFGARRTKEGKKGKGNKGKYSKRPMTKRKRYNAKIAKKADIRLFCSVCGKAHIMKLHGRFKKLEIKV